jgi:hypothetical protein
LCPVKTCMGVLLFSLVNIELFRTLYTRLVTSGHSSASIVGSDSTARKARITCLHADSIIQFDHVQFVIVKLCSALVLLYPSHHLGLEVAPSVRYL